MTQIDLVTGFLGAGKTTYIAHYTQFLARQGITFAIIENEFGAAGVDATMLRDIDGPVSELAGGCICCSLKINFVEALSQLAENYQRIIVEPSGIFALEQFFDVLHSPVLQGRCECSSIVTIVDPFALDAITPQAWEVFSSQLKGTGGVLLSHYSEITPDLLGRVTQTLAAHGLTKEIMVADWANLSDKEFEKLSHLSYTSLLPQRLAADHSAIFNSTTLYPAKQYTRAELLSICAALFDGGCGTINRIKGYVNSQDGASFLLNCTPQSITIASAPYTSPMVNIIGESLSRKRLKQILMKE